jgi:hypothetical protein
MKRYIKFFFPLVTQIFIFSNIFAQNIDYVKIIGGVKREISKDSSDMHFFTRDNRIYPSKRKFVFQFQYFDNQQNRKSFKAVRDKVKPFQWTFTAFDNDSAACWVEMTIRDTSLGRVGIGNEGQTQITYIYRANNQKDLPVEETTGLIENEKNIWLHPPRVYLFRIMELNPFPYIKFPLKKGKSWKWKLYVGSGYGDSRWKTWEGLMTIHYKYKVLDTNYLIESSMGTLSCYKIYAKTWCKCGHSTLVSYFHPSYGFVRQEFVNIDGSKINMELIKIE